MNLKGIAKSKIQDKIEKLQNGASFTKNVHMDFEKKNNSLYKMALDHLKIRSTPEKKKSNPNKNLYTLLEKSRNYISKLSKNRIKTSFHNNDKNTKVSKSYDDKTKKNLSFLTKKNNEFSNNSETSDRNISGIGSSSLSKRFNKNDSSFNLSKKINNIYSFEQENNNNTINVQCFIKDNLKDLNKTKINISETKETNEKNEKTEDFYQNLCVFIEKTTKFILNFSEKIQENTDFLSIFDIFIENWQISNTEFLKNLNTSDTKLFTNWLETLKSHLFSPIHKKFQDFSNEISNNSSQIKIVKEDYNTLYKEHLKQKEEKIQLKNESISLKEQINKLTLDKEKIQNRINLIEIENESFKKVIENQKKAIAEFKLLNTDYKEKEEKVMKLLYAIKKKGIDIETIFVNEVINSNAESNKNLNAKYFVEKVEERPEEEEMTSTEKQLKRTTAKITLRSINSVESLDSANSERENEDNNRAEPWDESFCNRNKTQRKTESSLKNSVIEYDIDEFSSQSLNIENDRNIHNKSNKPETELKKKSNMNFLGKENYLKDKRDRLKLNLSFLKENDV